MTDLPAWNVTRGPRLGEDIVAWCQEQCGEAVRECVTEGYMNLYVQDMDVPGHYPPIEPSVSFTIKDATVDDPKLVRTLDMLLREVVQDMLPITDDHDREALRRLRAVLRAHADILDKLLPPPE
jgi:hypothetical protein